MPALLFDQDSEIRCIKTLTDESITPGIRSTLLGKLSKEHFYNAPTLAAFNRIDTLAKKRFEIVDLNSLVADPVIDEDLRDILKSQVRKKKSCSNKKQISNMLDVLERYRKIRAVYGIAQDSFKELEKAEIDIDTLLNKVTEAVARANASLSEEQFFLNFGVNDSSAKIVDAVINRKVSPRIKTGYVEYDKRNGGLPEHGVFIISATTSGGKSVLAMNLAVRLYRKAKKSVCRISLEMDEEQETRRMASHLTKIPFNKFKENKLSMADKANVQKAFEDFSAFGKKHGIAYTTISPTRAVTIHDVFRMIKAFAYQIIMIDYIGLLAGMDSDSQWFQLSEVAAVSKRFSREGSKALVVILAQLDDTTDKLRYSKGIKEHADTMWQWNYTKPEQRDIRILPIRVEKDRDGEVFNFDLAERYDIMTAENMPDGAVDYSEEEEDAPPKSSKKDKGGKSGKEDKGSKKKKTKRATTADDDDDDAPAEYALS
ncbi:Replicative DNA helicase [compost metagenome]